MNASDLQAIALTLALAGTTTVLLIVLAMPLAWRLARRRTRLTPLIETTVALPLVLPPTVLGFYLLLALQPDGPVGVMTESLGLGSLVFSFPGLVIGSMIYSLPFAVQPMQTAFGRIEGSVLDAAATLGAGPIDRFATIVLPQSIGGVFGAVVLSFAHTLGEFGVVLMIGGSIPGETRVASIALFEHVEALDYGQAHALAASLLVLSVALLLPAYAIAGRGMRWRP